MFNTFTIIKSLLSIVDWFAKKAHDKQLLDAGEYKAIARANNAQIKRINKAITAGRSVAVDTDSLRNDKANRDGK